MCPGNGLIVPVRKVSKMSEFFAFLGAVGRSSQSGTKMSRGTEKHA
jgi:hypothetical protein